jgi:hypothetical protein
MFGLAKEQSRAQFSKKGGFIRKIVALVTVLFLAACNSSSPATSIPPTAIPPTETPLPHTTVDTSTMKHKLLMGYQGWFTCQGDGSNTGYLHWFKNDIPEAANFQVDMWPDTSELTPQERCPTNMKYPNGETAYLYSAYNPKTVMRHFQWMSQYGVDGVFVQRFGAELTVPTHFATRNVVTRNVQAGAEAYGRVFAVEYDTTGMDSSTFVNVLETDWKYMVDVLKITASPAYLHQNGKPVLEVWGVGFIEHPGSPGQAMELVNFFEHNPDPKYQVTLVGGVPHEWRVLQGDSQTDPAWANFYCALNVINPWTVGLYSSDMEVDQYKLKMIQDMATATKCGAEYMPVVFPGTAFHNNNHANLFNATPRRGGNLYWRQVYNAVSIGVPMIFNAMFDEVDEDTAMYKIAATKEDQPVGVDLVSMDTDGHNLPNDWYLRLAGAATQMLRGEIPLAKNIPIESGAVAPTPPTLLETPFTGTWQGPDPTDGSTVTLVLAQTGNRITGTFKDSYSSDVQPPGYKGSGSGTVLSASTAQMTFNLTRWDGKTVQAQFSLTLSNQNNSLAFGCQVGCPILQRQ